MATGANVDFTQLDMMVGVVAGAIVCLGLFILALKYKIVCFNGHSQESAAYCPAHSGIMATAEILQRNTTDEFRAVWLEIKEINLRQVELRQRLPEKYVNKDDLIRLENRLGVIDSKIDRIIELYRN